MAEKTAVSLTNAERDDIVAKSLGFGMTNAEIARQMNRSESTVCLVLTCLDMVKAENWNTVIYKIETCNWSVPLVEWAADRTAKKVPQTVYDAVARRTEKRREKYKNNEETQGETLPAAPVQNDAIYLVRVLEGLSAVVESNKAILDGLSALAADLKDNHNVNSDLICERLKEIGQTVETIKNNTRKKGL